jgi:RNA polymerase sigma-70 factor (ECF subfamily)
MDTHPTHQMTSDLYWIEQYRLGDRQALGVLYQRYFPKVYHKCRSFCKEPDQAFDLAQDALLKAFGQLWTFQGRSTFSTWLYALTYNHCSEFIRKSKRLLISRLEDYNNGNVEDLAWAFPEDSSLQEAADGAMLALLNKLPEGDKALLVLKYRDGESIKQLKAQFNISEGAIKMRLKRVRAKLNKLYLSAAA